ncbi:MAG: sterol desaturase family protein [Thermoflexibacteraceae bacterium]|jgi:lathosterol oxidase
MEPLQPFIPIFMNIFRYFLFAGIAYWIFYVWKRKELFYRKIQQKYPTQEHFRREIKYSVISAVIFGCLGTLVFWAKKQGYTLLYTSVSEYGWAYLVFTIFLLIFIHDTYFYWTHRLMHHPRIFKWVHLVHHQSHNTSPWTSFAFHPIEAIIEAAFFPIIVFVLPIHPLAGFIFLLYSIIMNVVGHTGFEFHPKNSLKHPFLKWFNTPTHHNLHHQYSRSNYGLYFNFWDKIMQTNDQQYEQKFDEVQARISHTENTHPSI